MARGLRAITAITDGAFSDEEIEGDRTQDDAEAFYRLLEDEIIPQYYQRSDEGVPVDFVKIMRAVIKSVAPHFSAQRMVKEYVKLFYEKALVQKPVK